MNITYRNVVSEIDIEDWFFQFPQHSTDATAIGLTINQSIDLTANDCRQHYLGSCFLKNFIVAINVLISIITTLGNVFVILAFYLDRQIRQPSNLFLCSLGVSDFCIGIFSIPFLTAYIYANQRWPFNTFCCDLWLSVDYSLCLVSIWTVLFITIDRYCSVKIPAKYRKLRTRRRVQVTICASWALPSLIFFGATFLYPKLSKEKKENLDPQTGVCDVRWKENKYFNLFLTLTYFWVTLFVMIALYVQIYRIASNLEKKSRSKAKRMASLVESSGRTLSSIAAITFHKTKTPVSINQSSSNNYEESSSSTSHYEDDAKTEECNSENQRKDEKSSSHGVKAILCFKAPKDQPKLRRKVKYTRVSEMISDDPVNAVQPTMPSKPLVTPHEVLILRNLPGNASKHKTKRRRKAAKSLRTITIILGAFVICWTPWHIYSIIYNFCSLCQTSKALNHVYLLFYYMCYLNSPVNPLCYALANQQFKRAFYRFMKCDFRRL